DVAGATDQVGLVLGIRQPAGGFRGGAALRQGIDRSTESRGTRRGIGMNGNEQVGTLSARYLGTPAQRDEVIAGTHQLATEAALGVDLPLQLPGNGQRHMFFIE